MFVPLISQTNVHANIKKNRQCYGSRIYGFLKTKLSHDVHNASWHPWLKSAWIVAMWCTVLTFNRSIESVINKLKRKPFGVFFVTFKLQLQILRICWIMGPLGGKTCEKSMCLLIGFLNFVLHVFTYQDFPILIYSDTSANEWPW
jgi:hypothetical protein